MKRIVLAATVFLVLFGGILYPNVYTLGESLSSVGTYVRFFSTPSSLQALWNSISISVGTVIFSAAIGVPLAFVFHRYDFFGRRVLRAVASAPVLLPPLVGVMAFLFLYGESGTISRFIQGIFGLESPWPRLTGIPAVLFVHAYSMYVYFFLFTGAGLERLDHSVEEAAESLGASRATTLRRAILPMLAPSLIGAALLTFMSSMASFSAPFIFNVRTLSVVIYNSKLNGNVEMALVTTVVLATSSIGVLVLLRSYESRRRYSAIGKGVVRPRAAIASSAARAGAGIGGGALVLFLLLPHLMVILMSFVRNGSWTTELLPPSYTTENYLRLLGDVQFFEPIRNSLWMAGAATGANLVWGLIATFWLRRRRGISRRMADVLIILPWALPGTVVAIAMLESFSAVPGLVAVLGGGSLALLPAVYFVRNVPLVYRAIDASFSQMDPAVEEASETLGAGTAYTIRRVVLPLVLPGAIAGSVLAFITALGDFVMSIMVYTYGNRPISIEILTQLRGFNYGTAAAYSALLILLIGLALGAGERVRTMRTTTFIP